MFYFDILEALSNNRIKYLIVGGLAVNLHNVPRMTNGLDLILSMDKDNLINFVNVMNELGYIPRLPVNPELIADSKVLKNWIEQKNMKAFSFYHNKNNYQVVDIVLVHPLNFEESYRNRKEKKLKDFTITIISIDDLIKMKKYSGRTQDLNDIEMLFNIKKIFNE